MDELRESSLLFSLEGLLETERERVQREAREAQRRRDEELVRVAEQASRRRLALEQERELRERRLATEQERERLENERIEAMKRAAVERARIEAEGKMRLVELEQARRHELAMSQLNERQSTAHYRTLTWLSSGAAVLSVAAGLGSYFGYVRPAHAREQQQLRAVLSAHADTAKTAERVLTAERSRNQTLSARVRELEARPSEPSAATAKPGLQPAKPGGWAGHGGTTVTPPSVCPDDGDPLRGCLAPSRRRR